MFLESTLHILRPFNLLSFLMLSFLTYGQTQVNIAAPKTIPTQSTDDFCQKAKTVIVKTTEFTATKAYSSALAGLKERIKNEPAQEYTVSFGRDLQDSVIVSPINTGSKSNGVLPVIENGFADLHNHPKSTPPSSGDLYGLLLKNRKNSRYDTRYILSSGNVLYALVVIDTLAAYRFADKYPAQQMPGYSPLFPDALLDEYRDMLYRYQVPEEMAMAFMLEKYATGVLLLKQNSKGELSILRTTVSGKPGALVFKSNNCR